MTEQPTTAELVEELRKAREALVFYGDPENYHAIGFWPDRPCGGFIEDFAEDHGHPDYDREMPGSKARASLSSIDKLLAKIEPTK